MESKSAKFYHESRQPSGETGDNLIEEANIPMRSKRLLQDTNYNVIKQDLGELPQGLHPFSQFPEVYWTDVAIDAATSGGREQIAVRLGIKLDQIISFSAAKHTNEVVIVDEPNGIHQVDEIVDEETGQKYDAGWSEPIYPGNLDQSTGAERKTYDGIILIGKDKFKENYLLATGADCTPVGIRGELRSGEEFIAIVHGGRKGTMTGVMENLAKRLQWLGVIPSTAEIFVGPAAQAIEVPLDVLEREGSDNNSWRASSVSETYLKDDVNRVLYNNQLDSVRRLVENLGVNGEQVHVMDIDTVSEESEGKLHSFRRDKTPERNSLVIGFKKN